MFNRLNSISKANFEIGRLAIKEKMQKCKSGVNLKKMLRQKKKKLNEIENV
jgi:hypothetical protein